MGLLGNLLAVAVVAAILFFGYKMVSGALGGMTSKKKSVKKVEQDKLPPDL